MRQARGLPGLLAGLLLFDFLLNLPGVSPGPPVGSLLVPAIDPLVIVAACMGIARAGERAQILLRVAVAVFTVGLLACSAGLRFGVGVEAHMFGAGSVAGMAAGWLVSLVLLAAAGGAAFLLSGLVVNGLLPPLIHSAMLLVIALAAVLQVVSGRRLFSASVIPRLIAFIGSQG